MKLKIVRPDSKGRITLGKLASGVSGFSVTVTKDHRIVLEPRVEIPANEQWLFSNQVALEKVRKGLSDAKSGKVKEIGSFAKFVDGDEK